MGSPPATDQSGGALAFELTPLSKLRVHVTGDEGSRFRRPCTVTLKLPAPGLRMTLPPGSEALVPVPHELTAETDETGVAEFTGLPPGQGYAAVATDLSDRRTVLGKLDEIEIPAGQVVDVETAMARGARILGKIIDSEGQPGEGFRVVCKSYIPSRHRPDDTRSMAGWGGEADCRSLRGGSFALDRLIPGKKRVRCERNTRGRIEAFTLQLTLAADEVRDAGDVGPVPLARGGSSLRGVVVDPGGVPVESATVRFSAGSPHEIEVDFETGPSGTFELAGMPAGDVFISAARSRAGRQWFVSTRPTLEPGTIHDIVLQLEPPPELPPGGYLLLTCRLPDGAPADLTELRRIRGYLCDEQGGFLQVAQGGLGDDDRTDPSILSLGRPPPGSYDVIAIGNGYVGRRQGCVVTDGRSERYELDLVPAIEVRGRVVDGETGEGVVARVLRLLQRGLEATDAVRTAADGTFAVHLFAPGEHGTLAIFTRDYEPEERPISGTDTDLGTIPLTRRPRESGR